MKYFPLQRPALCVYIRILPLDYYIDNKTMSEYYTARGGTGDLNSALRGATASRIIRATSPLLFRYFLMK